MKAAERIVRQALAGVRVIDPHCHLRPEKPGAGHLDDIVLYHHVWIELVSSGMSQFEVTEAGLPHELASPAMPPFERVRRALPYLHNIANTTVGVCLRRLLNDLYDVPDLNERTLDRAYAIGEEHASDPGWQASLLPGRCGIEASITVEAGNPTAQVLTGTERVLESIADGKRSSREILQGMEQAFGREIRNADDYRESLRMVIEGLPVDRLSFVNVWPTAYLNGEGATEEAVTRILRDVREGRVLHHDDVGRFGYFGLAAILHLLMATPVRTVQLIAGAQVLPPHRAITEWGETFTRALAELAGAYGDFHFSLSTASDAFTQDLGILAKHLPNVSLAGYWWHTLYPFYIRKSLETRLDMVPLNKIVGFFSDAYHAEWCYPKLVLVKEIVGDILVERIARGWYSTDLALEIVRALFYDNPRRIYGVA